MVISENGYTIISLVRVRDDPSAPVFRTRLASRDTFEEAMKLARVLKNEPLPHVMLKRELFMYHKGNLGVIKW